jgi:hypothetical protein
MKYVFVIFLFLLPFLGTAQKKDSLRFAVEVSGSYSYTGLGAQVALVLGKRSREFYLAGKTSITYLTRGNDFPIGFGLGYRSLFLQKKHLRPYFELSYENFFLKQSASPSSGTGLYQVHELYAGYGARLIYGHFSFGNTISYGGYAELHGELETEKTFFYHLGPKVKINLSYEF